MKSNRSFAAQLAFCTLTAFSVHLLSPHAAAADSSSIIDVTGAYNARDVVTSQIITGGYTVYGGNVHLWANDASAGTDGYRIGNIASGSLLTVGRPPVVNSNGGGDAFGGYDPANGLFYAGTYNNSTGSVYRYSESNSSWSTLGTFKSLYGADIQNGKLYVSGTNSIFTGSPSTTNQIALFDLSGGNAHDVLINTEGASANVALDLAGNVYFGGYNGSPKLYRWTSGQIASVRADLGNGTAGGGAGDLFLSYADAQILTTLPAGANGIAVDEGGNVFVTVNDFSSISSLLMWNSSLGTGDAAHFDTIADVDASQPFGFLGSIDTVGDFSNGGSVYLNNYGSNGLAEVQIAPEPTTLSYLGLSGLYIVARRRSSRQRKSIR